MLGYGQGAAAGELDNSWRTQTPWGPETTASGSRVTRAIPVVSGQNTDCVLYATVCLKYTASL